MSPAALARWAAAAPRPGASQLRSLCVSALPRCSAAPGLRRAAVALARRHAGTAKAPDLHFTKTHSWVRPAAAGTDQSAEFLVGVTDHAQSLLGEVWWLDLPKAGTTIRRDEVLVTVEGMRHPPEGTVDDCGGEPPWDSEIMKQALVQYQGVGWDVNLIQIKALGHMHSIKREVYAPADCVVVESNSRLKSNRDLVNEAAESDAWLVKVAFTEDLPDMLSAEKYADHCASELIKPLEE